MNVYQFYTELGLELKPMGTRWVSSCPFPYHKESIPSFVVYPDGSYHCFGCGAHGTVKDIQEEFEIDYRPYPDLGAVPDPMILRLKEIKDRAEKDLMLIVSDLHGRVKYQVYDTFDALFMDARALANGIETTLLDLVAFVQERFNSIKKLVENQ